VGGARHDAHVLIVGGGGTGGALAHDLALRAIRVTLVERGELTSGTTGRHHGLLHSGGRYAVNDRESAVECIEENRILRRICPGTFELNDGLFVAVEEEDLEYVDAFVEGCARRAGSRPSGLRARRRCGSSRTSTRTSSLPCAFPTGRSTRCGCRCGSSRRLVTTAR
jgi:glycerol-3-phosphate dehydrogenase